MNDVLSLIGRDKELFIDDICDRSQKISDLVSNSRFLVLGGAGSIGQAVVKEIFKRNPLKLDVVDLSENNLVELVRDLRSSVGYTSGTFNTYALDISSLEYDAFFENDGAYDYVLNLSALKHVRSEKDPYTLMRMINVNITNTVKTLRQCKALGVKKYFCVSTDKAANPVNMMGASKSIMEMFVNRESKDLDVSMSRFANVAFSDGSLLHGFQERLLKNQPIVAPNDVKRYFVTPKESGELCLLSCLFGDNRDIFFPKLSEALHLTTFSEIAERFLYMRGYKPYLCETEDEARSFFENHSNHEKLWPCLFSASDTTGEKSFEEFFTKKETLDLTSFHNLGIIKNDAFFDNSKLEYFEKTIAEMLAKRAWAKTDLVRLFQKILYDFDHFETGKYLDSKM